MEYLLRKIEKKKNDQDQEQAKSLVKAERSAKIKIDEFIRDQFIEFKSFL